MVRPSSISPEEARDLRACALKFALDCHFRKQNAAGEKGGDDMICKRIFTEPLGSVDVRGS